MQLSRILVALCLAFADQSVLSTLHGQDAAQTRTAQFPDRPLGWYSIIGPGIPRRPTMREDSLDRANDRQLPKLQSGELKGKITYPHGSGLWIALTNNEHGNVREKLRALDSIDSADVHALAVHSIVGQPSTVDLDCLKLISRFENLRDLTMTVTEELEGAGGCAFLERLAKLTYLELYRDDTCVFGSTRFCETLRSLPQLEFLSIPCEKLTDKDVAIIASHPALRRIQLRARRPRLGPQSLHALQRMKNLKELFIVCIDDIQDSDVLPFAEIKSLEWLSMATNAPLTCQERLAQRRPDCVFFFQEPSNEFQ